MKKSLRNFPTPLGANRVEAVSATELEAVVGSDDSGDPVYLLPTDPNSPPVDEEARLEIIGIG